jgi:predicted RNA-binding protein with TRAM domain
VIECKDVKILSEYQEKVAPVQVGESYDVSIDDLAKEGDGIARVEGFVIFVPQTKVGDKVTIKVNKVMRKFAIAEKTA